MIVVLERKCLRIWNTGPGVNWLYVNEKNVEFVKELSVTNQKLREVERNIRDQ